MTKLKLAEQVWFVPLTDIFVDYDWNGRSHANVFADVSDGVADEGQQQGEGFAGLKASLHEDGQRDAVIVRPVDSGVSLGGKPTSCKFELVCGFRRVSAILSLMTEKKAVRDNPDGQVRAIIRQLSPDDAEVANGVENIQRHGMTAPDLVLYVRRLLKKHSNNKISTLLGVNRTSITRFARVAQLPESVLAHWARGAPLHGVSPNVVTPQLSLSRMEELQKLTAGKTEYDVTSQYVDWLSVPAPAEGPRSPAQQSALTRVKRHAQLLGQLCGLGVLSPGTLKWHLVIGPKSEGFLIDSGASTAAVRARIWEEAEREFQQALQKTKAGLNNYGEKNTDSEDS